MNPFSFLKKPLFLVVLLSMIFSSAGCRNPFRARKCEDLLTDTAKLNRLVAETGRILGDARTAKANQSEALANFFASPRLIVNESTLVPSGHREFYFSNEEDFYNAKLSLEPRDVFIGFGNNNAWDLAVRHDAKLLVLADWEVGPVQVQEMIFRPLILAARSPADFLSLLTATPLPVELQKAPLSQVFNYIKQRNELIKMNPDRTFSKEALDQRAAAEHLFSERAAEIRFRGDVDEKELSVLEGFYRDLIAAHYDPSSFRPTLSITPQGIAADWRLGALTGRLFAPDVLNFLDFFENRYSPESLIAKGADPAVVNHPLFSFLSSQLAFDRLKKLFSDSVYFAVTDVNNVAFYERVQQLAHSHGLSSFALGTVNIFTCMETPICSVGGSVRRLMARLVPLFASEAYPLLFHQTIGAQEPHRFEDLNLRSLNDLEQVLTQHGYPPPGQERFQNVFPADHLIDLLTRPGLKIEVVKDRPGETLLEADRDLGIIIRDGEVILAALRTLPGETGRFPLYILLQTERERAAVLSALRIALAPLADRYPIINSMQMMTF